MLGRRGPAQAAFTSAELRELGHLDGVDLRVDADERRARPRVARVAGRGGHLHRAQERGAAARVRGQARAAGRPAADRAALPALAGGDPRDGRVEAIDVRRNEIVAVRRRLAAGARPWTRTLETIECGLVLRSVGYRAVPLPDVPFDERSFVLPNERGRVLTPDGEPLPGVYAVGWIKRGPTGILGTNKRDAEETVSCLAEDLAAAALPQPPNPGREQIDALLAERKPDLVTVDGWRAIDAPRARARRSEQRPRVKLASRDELLAAAT